MRPRRGWPGFRHDYRRRAPKMSANIRGWPLSPRRGFRAQARCCALRSRPIADAHAAISLAKAAQLLAFSRHTTSRAQSHARRRAGAPFSARFTHRIAGRHDMNTLAPLSSVLMRIDAIILAAGALLDHRRVYIAAALEIFDGHAVPAYQVISFI